MLTGHVQHPPAGHEDLGVQRRFGCVRVETGGPNVLRLPRLLGQLQYGNVVVLAAAHIVRMDLEAGLEDRI